MRRTRRPLDLVRLEDRTVPTFGHITPTELPSYSTSDVVSMVGGDFDADGRGDLAALAFENGSATARSVTVYRGKATADGPTFDPIGKLNPQNDPFGVTDDIPRDLAVGDFNQDGKADLAILMRAYIAIYPGSTNGLGNPQFIALRAIDAPTNLLAGDFHNLGRPELVTIGDADQLRIVRFGAATPEVLTARIAAPAGQVYFLAAGTGSGNNAGPAIGEFTGDGKPDLLTYAIAAPASGGTVDGPRSTLVLKSVADTDGYFQVSSSLANVGPGAIALRADGDSRSDVAVLDAEAGVVNLFRSKGGDARFDALGTLTVATKDADGQLTISPQCLTAGALAPGAADDLAVGYSLNFASGPDDVAVRVFPATGQGTFGPPITPPGLVGTLRSVDGLAAFNTDGDGMKTADLAVIGNFLTPGKAFNGVGGSANLDAPPTFVSTTTVTVAPTTAPLNQDVAVTVHVAGGPTPTGNVILSYSYTEGGLTKVSSLGSGSIDANGDYRATLSGQAVANTYRVTAIYQGDSIHSQSNGSATATVTGDNPPSTDRRVTKVLTVNPNPVAVNQNVTITAQFTSPAGTPRGTVTFRANNAIIGFPDMPVTNGLATLTTSFSVENTQALTATFTPEAPFINGPDTAASTVALIVGPGVRTETAVLPLESATVTPGQLFTVTVQVTPASGTLPGGRVTVFVGNNQFGETADVDATGRAHVLGRVNFVVGDFPVTATFSGSGRFAASRALDGPLVRVTVPQFIFSSPSIRPAAPAPLAASAARPGGFGLLSTAAAPTQTVFLNFDGGDAGDALGPGSFLPGVPAFQADDVKETEANRPAVIAAIMQQLDALYAGSGVVFTTTRPAGPKPSEGGQYMEVVIGGSALDGYIPPDPFTGRMVFNFNREVQARPLLQSDGRQAVEPLTKAPATVSSVTTVFGYLSGLYQKPVYTIQGSASGVDRNNTRKNDYAVIFSSFIKAVYADQSSEGIRQRLAVTIAHEVGHNLGLQHLSDGVAAGSIMKEFSPRSGDETFRDQDVPLPGRNAGTENSAAYLRSLAAVAGSAAPAGARRLLSLDFTNTGRTLNDVVVGVRGGGNSADSLPEGADASDRGYEVRLPGGTSRLALTLPSDGMFESTFYFYGSSVPGGPPDIFSGTFPDGTYQPDRGDIPLFGPDGLLNTNIPVSFGLDGQLQPVGTAVLESRDGFVRHRAGDPAPSATTYVVGADAGDAPLVQAYDGRSGNPYGAYLAFEQSFTGGVRVATADVNGDGIPDVIAGAGAGGGPRVRVLDGADGTQIVGPLGDFFAYEDSFRGGVTVAVGDVNGDGFQDVVVGSGLGGGPRVRVLSGATGSVIYDFFAYEDSFRGGVNVSVADVNGDGRADIAVGSGVGGGPRVRVFSGADLAELANYFAYEDSFRGGVNVALGDVDGDAVPDVVAGSGVGGGPVVRSFSGKTGAELAGQIVFDESARSGIRVATVRTSDTSAKASIVVAPGPGSGPRVRVIDALTGDSSADAFAFSEDFLGGVFVG